MGNDNVGHATEALTNASNDTSSIINDSVVWLDVGCSGVLISSNIVLTAGHCIDDDNYIEVGSRRKVWEWCDLKRSVTVQFGNDKNNPTFAVTASKYSQGGAVDMVMLLLDNPVPTTIAIPSKPLTRIPLDKNPVDFLRHKEFILSGWGYVTGTVLPRFRQTAPARYGKFPFAAFGVENHSTMKILGADGAVVQPGDSGSPLLWENPYSGLRYTLAIAQGVEPSGGRFKVVFGKGGVNSNNKMEAKVGLWIDRMLYSEILPDPGSFVPLFSWWNDDRKDNFMTTRPQERGMSGPYWDMEPTAIVSDETLEKVYDGNEKSGYKLYRLEGYAFDPKQPQPGGTVPLYGWWNNERKDNLVTTKPSWGIDPLTIIWDGERVANSIPEKQGYRLSRLEGYIFDPQQPQPADTIPLYSWWNSERKENFSSTDPVWGIDPNSVEWRGENIANNVPEKWGYKMYRLEGYVFPNLML